MSKVDLHLHTTASDGRSTPSELVTHALIGGVTVMAVTDHDTTAACTEVIQLAHAGGIDAVAGIEITAVSDTRDVHVLGYFIDPDDASLATFLVRQRENRVERLEAMGAKLAELGVSVDVAAIVERGRREQSRSIGRPQLARAMVDAGHVRDTREAFDKWLIEGCPAFVPRTGATVEDVIDIIHRAGGVASIAHPGKTGRMDDRLAALRNAGLDALEVFHPDHDAAAVARYQQVADDLGLLMTGGSDFHGDPGHGLMPGSVTLPQPQWERLLDRRGIR